MKLAELRAMSSKELKNVETTLRRQQFKARLVRAAGESKKTDEVRKARRELARVKTLLTEKEKVKE